MTLIWLPKTLKILWQLDLYDIDKAAKNSKNLSNIFKEIFFCKLKDQFPTVENYIVTAEDIKGDDFGDRTQYFIHFFF
jgi:hypothetical protein